MFHSTSTTSMYFIIIIVINKKYENFVYALLMASIYVEYSLL